ncbi:MAG: L,D-transpeptidase family protein [Ferruginibacter sp.]
MNRQKTTFFLFLYLLCWGLIISCNNSPKKGEKTIVKDPAKMDEVTTESIKDALAFGILNKGLIDDSIQLKMLSLVNDFYAQTKYETIWSHKEKWEPLTDSLLNFIEKSELYGLFPSDYHLESLRSLKTKLDTDSLNRMDAQLWTTADLMLTDGFIHLLKDLKIGRLNGDSTFSKKLDSAAKNDFFISSLKAFIADKQLTGHMNDAEPKHFGYQELKNAIPAFLDSMDKKEYTYVPYPYKPNDIKDSLFVIKKIQKRLNESGCIELATKLPDTLQLLTAIKKFQKKKGIKQDGKITAALVRVMNLTDVERFKRIAITLDRYKKLPDDMPEKYIWVNLPTYYLQVYDHDTVALVSKVIIGKPITRTPLLYSVISDMVTYPTWTVPNSIIKKQFLPKLKMNPYYLASQGLKLMDDKGEIVNPGTVNWSKYKNGIPYKVVQGSGDDNALGILKFNFKNPYSVYLHDTNQRYLFKNSSRALSHGCVRVEQWEELAFFIARNDSMNLKEGDTLPYNTDSIKTWLGNKEKKRIPVKNGVPLFITYFSCEAKGEKIKFYEDIYGDDKLMREKYFSDKSSKN